MILNQKSARRNKNHGEKSAFLLELLFLNVCLLTHQCLGKNQYRNKLPNIGILQHSFHPLQTRFRKNLFKEMPQLGRSARLSTSKN